MRKNFKKFMALAMAGTLMCSSVTALAAPGTSEETASGASGSTTGSSTVEGYVNPDVFTVVLPTDDTDNPVFNFTLDPQKLLNATDSNYTDPDATVLFDTKTGTSTALEVKNKGNVMVNVAVTATASNLSDTGYSIPLVADNTFVGDTTTSLYLGLKVGNETPVALDSTSGATATCVLDGVDEDNFEIVKNPDGSATKYSKQLKNTVTDADFPATTFALTGACNGNADWSAATGATPSVTVTWTLTEVTDLAPSAPQTATFVKGTDAIIPVSLGKGNLAATKIKSVTCSNTKTGSYAAQDSVKISGSSIIVGGSSWGGAAAGNNRYMKVVFDDAANTTAIIEFTVAVPAAPSAPATYTFTKGTATTVPVSLGAGNLAATSIKSVTCANTKTSAYAAQSTVTINGSSIVLGASTWGAATAGDNRYMKVTFDDAANTEVIIEFLIQ